MDAPLSDLLPAFAPAGATSIHLRALTLEALASQQSGIAREVPMPCAADVSDCNLSTAEVLPVVNELPLLWAPGRRPAYSNLGFALLGRALETVSDPPRYEAFVEARQCRLLGMNHSGFTWTEAVLQRLARGAEPQRAVTHLGWAAPSGEMFSTAQDMSRFLNFLTEPEPASNGMGSGGLGVGDHVLPLWRRRSWLSRVSSLLPDEVSAYGLPWELQLVSGRWLRTKAGNIDQFGSQIAADPGLGLAVWVGANREGSEAASLAADVNRKLFPAFRDALAAFDDLAYDVPTNAPRMVGT